MLLAGCDSEPAKPAGSPKDALSAAAAGDLDSGSNGSFDYRYAFRLRGDRLKEVLQSNADGCDKLGPARCRILAMRYRVDAGNHIRAVLTLRIDPAIARAYGEAAVKTLQSADGLLVDSEVSGADSTSSARSAALIDRLRDRLKGAQTAAATDPNAKVQAAKIQSALDTIAESEAGQGQTLATAPVLISYESSSALTGLGSADANFRSAGSSLESSVARLLIVLAAVGPWLLALIVLIMILRLVVHGTGGGREDPEPQHDNGHNGHDDDRHDNRNLIQRWFNRDDEREPEQHPHG
jgi:hypothetical protein